MHTRSAQPLVAKAKELNRMRIDVVVEDATGQAVTGLQPWNFKVADNGKLDKIQFFRAFDRSTVKPENPVEVILILDELNLSMPQVAFAREEIARFLHRNGGRLSQPVSLMLLTGKGLEVQPHPSLDGNAVAEVLKAVAPHVSSINAAMGLEGALDRFNRSVRQVQLLAENETHKPGRSSLSG